MRTFTFNLAFVIAFIFFCSPVAVGSPPLEAEYLASIRDSTSICNNIKHETWSFSIEAILSPKKYLARHLEFSKKADIEAVLSDSVHRPVAVEKKMLSTAGEKDAHPSVSSLELTATSLTTQAPTEGSETLSIIPEKESSSAPIIEEKENLHEKSSIANSNQPVDKVHPLVVEEKGTQTPAVVDNMLLQFLTGKEPPTVTDEGHQPIVSFPETLQETKEESTPMTIFTPELQSGTIAGGESLPVEAEGTQTLAVDDKSHLPTDENGSSFTSAEESSYTATVGSTDVLIKEAEEPEKGISSPEPTEDTVKDAKDLKPAWGIWHKDPTHNVLLAVAIILIAAKIAGWMARMLRLPEVVGKLIIGMILGNVFAFTGWDFFDFLRTMPFVKMISYFGTLILLFTAGLNTDLRALLRVGTSSLLVCLGGVIVPAGLGLMVGHFLLPDTASGTKLLLAIILCNSSTGLLLAVLSELKAINTLEGRVIAGATILTDIVVILTFGVVSEFVARGGVSLIGMSVSFGIAITSLIISLITILRYGEKFGNFLTRRITEGLNIPIVVILSLLTAFMFGSVGLHTVIGAFIAGLFLRNVKLRDSDDGEHRNVESFIRPFYMLLVPILFVRVGAQVEIKSFLNMEAVSLGIAITGAAVIGKMFCSVCPIEKGINRLAIGIGMVTKMEGTLILSGIARDMGLLNDAVFSSIIMVIALTSTICPSLLRLSLRKKGVHRKGLPIATEKKELEEVTLN